MTSPSPASVEPITVADRERAKGLCAKATAAPWIVFTCDGFAAVLPAMRSGEITKPMPDNGDADFIAFSRTAIPSYEARVVELEAALKEAVTLEELQEELDLGVSLAQRLGKACTDLEAAEARATALLEAVSVDEVVQWLKARPGISWEATFRDIEKAVAGVLEARAAINAGASNDRK